MKKFLLKSLVIGLFLLAMPTYFWGQRVNNHVIELNLEQIENPDLRYCILANIASDSNYEYTIDEDNNTVLLFSAEHWTDSRFQAYFDETMSGIQSDFDIYSRAAKERQGETFSTWKSALPQDLFVLLFRLMLIENPNSRDGNQHCVDSDPFCTTDVVTFHVSGSASGVCENGPDYGCMSPYTARPPFWFHMKIGVAGTFTIRITNSNNLDLDFCAWGPFTDPTTPCPSQLTASKIIDCDSPSNTVQECTIPTTAQVGQYYIMVITKYSSGSTDITFQKSANSGPGETDCGILPGIASNNGPYCVGDDIHLRVNSQEGATYSWTGPNFSSTQQNPSIPNCTLANAGTYTCVTTVGTHSVTASTDVQVFPRPTANFSAAPVCLGSSTRFNNSSTTNPANQTMNYLWDFGDGQTSTQQSPTHQYNAPGNYNASLTVNCGNGACTSTRSQTVVVYDNPVANAGSDQTVQYGGIAQLRGSGGTGSTTTFNYHWEPANKVANPNAQNTQTIALHESTTFTLTVTHPQGGCTSSDEMTVLVEGSNMSATASANPAIICSGESTQLNAQAIGGAGNYTYSWSPSIGLSNPIISNPIATPSNTTTYTCTVSDGYSTQNVSTRVTVNDTEYEEINEYICPGETFPFYGQEYGEEGNYVYETTTAQGCEKVITLHLHYYPSYNNAHTIDTSICYGQSCLFHGQHYTTTGSYYETLETVHGCDSIVWLNLNVYPANDTIIDKQYICSDQTLTWHGNEYNQNGDVAYYQTEDYHGCLQVYKLELYVRDYQTPPNYTPDKYVCVPHDEEPHYYWRIADRHYYQNAQDTLIVEGYPCDTLYTLNLQFHQEHYTYSTPITDCDSYYWPVSDSTYTITNHQIKHYIYTEFGPNQSCRDTYELDLTINNTYEGDVNVTKQCDRYDWQFGWHGETETFTEPGNYTRTINTHEDGTGCDSIVTLHLQMDYRPQFDSIYGKWWPLGGSEFTYTVERYWIETHPNSTHTTEWKLYDIDGNPFNKWEIIPYGNNGDKCYLYIYTFERDSIRLEAHTTSPSDCGCGEYYKSLWIRCSPYDIDETFDSCSVDIFPNPNDGNMTLSFDNLMGEALVKIYNITGTLVDQFTLHNDFGHLTHTYQSGKLSPGVYFFNIINKKSILTKKVVVID